MRLYLIEGGGGGYDTHSSAVVAAESVQKARTIHPSGGDSSDGTWVTPDRVAVTYIGTAKKGTKRGVICASFHAG